MNTKFKGILRDQRVLLALVIALLVIVVTIINPRFVRLNNIIAIFNQISVLGVLTMAMAMLLISGGIDLSIGSMMALCGIVVATVLMNGQSMLVALLARLWHGPGVRRLQRHYHRQIQGHAADHLPGHKHDF